MRSFSAKECRENIKRYCRHDVLEPSKQAQLASRDVMISSQKFGSKWQRVIIGGLGGFVGDLGSFVGDLGGFCS